jgi:hypothetical protein
MARSLPSSCGRDVPGMGVVALYSSGQRATGQRLGDCLALRWIRRRHAVRGCGAGIDAGSGLLPESVCSSIVVERHTLRTLHSDWAARARRGSESMDRTSKP